METSIFHCLLIPRPGQNWISLDLNLSWPLRLPCLKHIGVGDNRSVIIFFILLFTCFSVNIKLGGLNLSWDQSRLRSRFLDVSRQSFKNCQDFLDCWDKLLFCLGQDYKIETFQLRLCHDKFFYWDCQDESIFVEKSWHFWDFLSLKMAKSLNEKETLTRNMLKSTYFFIKIRTNN